MAVRNTIIGLLLVMILIPCQGHAADSRPQLSVRPGKLVVEPPTLISLGFEWYIAGDDNRNAAVAIQYRKQGEAAWRQGLPMLRLHGERTFLDEVIDYTAPNMFAGSIFDLEPDTAYEIRLTLADPDGVEEGNTHTVAARTRPEPMPAAGGRILHVYPPGYTGDKQEPAYGGLLAAFYKGGIGGDWSNAPPPRVQPGDTILVHAGVYKDDTSYYSHEIISGYTSCCYTTWDGTYYLTVDGTAERPIVIKAAGDGEVVFDGNNNEVLFNVMAADYLYFEGLTFRNTRTAILAGRKQIAGAAGLTVKRSRFEDIGIGIHTDYSGSKNFYIADNMFIGRHDPARLTGWLPQNFRGNPGPWVDEKDYEELSKIRSYYAIKVYGSGHVIAYNHIRNVHDGIDHATYGMPDGYPDTDRDRMPVSIDIYNNDISNVHDNCMEADGSMHNIRIMRNRCFNSGTGAMSPQPVFGGPAYFIRNVVYHGVDGPIKVHGNPSGAVFYHNTYIGELAQLTPASNFHFRNNLILGQQRKPELMVIDAWTNYSSSDYNGLRPNAGFPIAFRWNSPHMDQARDYALPLQQRSYATLVDLQAATGQEAHSVLVDYDIFVSAAMPDPATPTRLYRPDEVNLQLRSGSAAQDAGMVLPNVNDDYSGAAPDLGAYEIGKPAPHYGPREL
jgi:hypothetical protein